jgi:methylated-DNA-[protein]-cysteine S-methyltransferase
MASTKHAAEPVNTLLVFPSDLGWMAVLVAGKAVRQLTFGHRLAAAARKALDSRLLEHAKVGKSHSRLVQRLQAYSSGCRAPLGDIAVDPGPASDFQRRVWRECRRIPFGKTLTYAELAARAGSPRAARAVGSCMACNRIPLLIPCHRVVCSSGQLGSYSARGGVAMKRRILTLEGVQL